MTLRDPLDYAPYSNREIPDGGRESRQHFEHRDYNRAVIVGERIIPEDDYNASLAYPECEQSRREYLQGWWTWTHGWLPPRDPSEAWRRGYEEYRMLHRPGGE